MTSLNLIVLSVVLVAAYASDAIGQCRFNRNGSRSAPGGHILVEKIGPKMNAIQGTVADQSGEPITETVVILKRLTSNGKKYVATSTTNYNGFFCFGRVSPGKYVLETGRSGFNPLHTYVNVPSKRFRIRRSWVLLTLEIGT